MRSIVRRSLKRARPQPLQHARHRPNCLHSETHFQQLRHCHDNISAKKTAPTKIVHDNPDGRDPADQTEKRIWDQTQAESLLNRFLLLEQNLTHTLSMFKNLTNLRMFKQDYYSTKGIGTEVKLIAGATVCLVAWYCYSHEDDVVTETISEKSAKVVAQTLQVVLLSCNYMVR